jgi:hypothetical protein
MYIPIPVRNHEVFLKYTDVFSASMAKTLRRIRSFFFFRLIPLVILLAVAGFICLGFFSFSPDILKTTITSGIARMGVDSVYLSKASIRPWSGIRFDNLYIRIKDTNDRSIEFQAARIRLTYSPMAVIIENKPLRKVLGRTMIMARRQGDSSRMDAGIKAITQLISERCMAEAIKSIHINGARLIVWQKEQELLTADEVNAALQMCSKDSTCCGGTIDAGVVMINGNPYFIRPSATVRLSDQLLDVSKVKSFLYDGTLRGSFAMNIVRKKLMHAEFKLATLGIEKWYESQRNPEGALKGKLSLSLICDSSALRLDSIIGQGSCRIKNVIARNLPVQKSLVQLLVIPQLSNLEFHTVTSDFIIVDGRVNVQNLKGNGELLDLETSGWVARDGTFYQEVLGVLSKKFSAQLPDIVQKSLLPRDNGRLSFDCRVSGTFDNPSLSLNQQIIKRAVKNMLESLQDDIKGFFK